jgi:5-methylcytosine-specific restriction endonuclease McrA
MVFIRIKRIKKYCYAVLCKSVRKGNKVKQITIKYLGRIKNLESGDEIKNFKLEKCKKCGTKKNLTIDHIIPLSKGGTNKFSNLQCLCKKCNQKKGKKW